VKYETPYLSDGYTVTFNIRVYRWVYKIALWF